MAHVFDPLTFARALAALARRFQLRSRDDVCCYGLTPSQCHALESLEAGGVLTTSGLAARLGLDLSTTTRLAAQLARRKLLRRSPGRDRRVRELALTDAGRRLVERMEQDLAASLARVLAGEPAPVLQALPGIVARIAAALDARLVSPVRLERKATVPGPRD